MGKIAEIWVEIGARVEGFNKNLSDVEKATKKIGESLSNAGRQMTIAGAAIVGSLGLMIKKAADFGDELWELQEKTGISTEVLSSLKLAADKGGTSIDMVARGMRFLSDEMIKTTNAGDASKTILGQLGIAAKDADGSMRPLNDVLFDVADKFALMEDGAVKVKLAVELFGRSGMAMIPMLNDGRRGLQENAEIARKLGIIYSQEDAKAAHDFSHAMIDLKGAFAGTFKMIASELIPIVRDLSEKITAAIGKVQEWTKAHPELIRLIKELAVALGGLGVLLAVSGPLLFGLGQFLQMYAKMPGILKTASLAVIAAAAAIKALTAAHDAYLFSMDKTGKGMTDQEKVWQKFTNGLEKATGGMTDFVALAIRANAYHPKLAAGMNIVESGVSDLTDKYGGFRGALKAIYEGGEGEAFQTFLKNLGGNALSAIGPVKTAGESIKTAVFGIGEAIYNYTLPAINALAATVGTTFAGGIGIGATAVAEFKMGLAGIAEEIKEWTIPELNALAATTKAVGQGMIGIGATASASFKDVILPVLDETNSRWETLCTDFGQSWANMFEGFMNKTVTFSNFFKTIWQNIGSMFKKFISQMVADYAAGVMRNVIMSQKEALGSVIAGVMKLPFPLNFIAVVGAMAAVSALFSKIGLAEGGIVTQPTLAIVGERGPEAVVPLDKAGGFGGQRAIHFHNDIYVGGRKVDEQIVKVIEEADALGNLRLRKAFA